MKFYNREDELKTLHNTLDKAKQNSQMTFITGRRRIGKTRLILKAYEKSLVYFFVSKKTESLLCEEFVSQIEISLNIKVFGKFEHFSQLFGYLLELSKTQPFTLAIDEFQEFYAINPSIYADLQHLWDRHKDSTRMNLILSGSVYSLMHKIFEQAKEPLYGRANKKMRLSPFNSETIYQVYSDHAPTSLKAHDMFAFYTITGGVAKYIEILTDNRAFSLEKIIDIFFENSSIFVHEGRELLIEEFGKDYTTYFSILSLIASSKTSRSEIESILKKSVGGYLERLEHHFNLIKTIKPIFHKPNSRTQKYLIEDNFLSFWFRFIYKHQSAIEIENFDYVKSVIKADFNSYAGRFLEKYFIDKLKLTKQFSQIGSYWERGNKNEIDIVAINEREKFALIAEVKLSAKRLQLNQLQEKAKTLSQKLQGYTIHYRGFSLDDIFSPMEIFKK